MRPRPLVLAVIALSLSAAACGSAGDGADDARGGDARTVEIEMRDIAYSPGNVSVTAGETIRFVFTNTGEVVHDAFIGDDAAQRDHGMDMTGNSSGMDHGAMGDASTDAITVEPGETGELMYTFEQGDGVLIGCHQPGHYEAGMRLTIDAT